MGQTWKRHTLLPFPSQCHTSVPRRWEMQSSSWPRKGNLDLGEELAVFATVVNKEMVPREGVLVCVWLIHLVVQWRLTQYCKATILQ